MSKALRISALAIAGATATGLIGYTAPALADDGGVAYKRDDESGRVVTTADLDDDDDTTGTNTSTGTGDTNSHAGAATGDSRSRADGTNSRVTNVSRDRDLSRADKTKDWTRDGGDRTRDNTSGATNDRSRNDTRR